MFELDVLCQSEELMAFCCELAERVGSAILQNELFHGNAGET